MPSAILQVEPQGGDLLAEKISGVAAATPATRSFLGWANVLTQQDGGWIGRFELPIPDGAVITGAMLTFYSTANSLPVGETIDRMVGGLLEPDGIWNAAGGVFGTPSYATRTLIPWPERDFGSTFPTRWFASTPAFSAQSFQPAGGGTAITWGEGLASSNPVEGLVEALQGWLDTYGPSLRGGSVSGSDLPVALCWYRAYSGLLDPTEQYSISSSRDSLAFRPTLTVSWVFTPEAAAIRAEADLRPAVRSYTRIRGA